MTSVFETVASREVYRGRVRVRVDELHGPTGERLAREIVEAIDSVVVVPVIGDEVVFVRQHRQATGGLLLELPAGVRDVEGESAVDVAARELAEETAMGGGELTELGTFWASPGWTTQRFTVVVARDVEPVGRPGDFTLDGEERHLEVVRLSLDDALAAVADRLVDASGALALLLAAREVRGWT